MMLLLPIVFFLVDALAQQIELTIQPLAFFLGQLSTVFQAILTLLVLDPGLAELEFRHFFGSQFMVFNAVGNPVLLTPLTSMEFTGFGGEKSSHGKQTAEGKNECFSGYEAGVRFVHNL